MSKIKNSNLNLIIIFKKNKIHIWIFLAVFILVFSGSIFYIKTHPDKTMYISQSEFKVINGEKTLNLYLGTYNRITTIDDVATVVNFLCSEEHMYIHGQVIGINGGLAI